MEVPHISWEYSENILVQNSARKVLKYKLGLKFLFAITLLLTKIKSIIYAFNHWRDKEETQSIISVLIRDLLWADLPESYADATIANYRQQIFEYVYNTYPAA